jgi:8-oxo-dGTP pyrophosphatase MutT (NUDIX family)
MPDVPITLLARREVCRNSVFTVYFDHIRDATGNEVTDYLTVVPHHKAANGVTGVAVLPVLENKFGLIRVFRHSLGDYCWEVVRGFVDQGETPLVAALRELREEAALVAPAGSLRNLGALAPEPGVLEVRIRLFAAEGCARDVGSHCNEMGHREMKYFTRDALAGMIDHGEIMDPCTLVCCYRYLGVLS